LILMLVLFCEGCYTSKIRVGEVLLFSKTNECYENIVSVKLDSNKGEAKGH